MAFTKSKPYFLYLASAYLVLPLVHIPLLDLSISAILLFFVVLEAVFRPPRPWSEIYHPYEKFAVFIFMGIFLSALVNSFFREEISAESILTVIRHAYWLLIFVVIVYVASERNLLSVLVRVLGWSIFALAILRSGEILLYGNIGEDAKTYLLQRNAYGFQFSTFFPFFLGMVFLEKMRGKVLAIFGIIFLLGTIAINGSRGSWIAVGVSLLTFSTILIFAKRRVLWKWAILLSLVGSVAVWIFFAYPQFSQTVETRWSTFQNLDHEKSYAIRTLMRQKALQLFEQYPFFGIGPGRFSLYSAELDIPQILQYESQQYFNEQSAHNSYLCFLAENGLSGMIPLAALLAFLTIAGLRAAISLTRQNQYWGAAIYTSFIGMSVHMWGISTLTTTSAWYIYGLVGAMIILGRSIPKEKTR